MDEQIKRLLAEETWKVEDTRVSFLWGDFVVLGRYDPDNNTLFLISNLEDEDRAAIWPWVTAKLDAERRRDDGEYDLPDQESGD